MVCGSVTVIIIMCTVAGLVKDTCPSIEHIFTSRVLLGEMLMHVQTIETLTTSLVLARLKQSLRDPRQRQARLHAMFAS